MNKQIKQLLENLFDDYDDIIQDKDDIGDDIIVKKLKEEEQKNVKEWFCNNISTGKYEKFINNIDKYVTFEYIGSILYCNLVFTETLKFERLIPDYVKINKIKGDCEFHSSNNLPKEIDGSMTIESDEAKFTGIFPQKIKSLQINCPNLKSLEDLNNSSIRSLKIVKCYNLQDLIGLPDSVRNLSLENCDKLENLIGCPESVENISLQRLKKFSSLKGCPAQLNNLLIHNCNKLKSLKYISPLIKGDFTVMYTGLVDLSNGPKEVGGDYYYYCNSNSNEMKHLNAQDTVMTGHNKRFYCNLAHHQSKLHRDMYIENVLKKELPKMNKYIEVNL